MSTAFETASGDGRPVSSIEDDTAGSNADTPFAIAKLPKFRPHGLLMIANAQL
jgi:hypothetical protein